MNFLRTILDQKRKEVSGHRAAVPVAELQRSEFYDIYPHSLSAALRGHSMAVIAEIKKSSPSKNVIRKDFDPLAIALECVSGGASALSILTDSRFFQGDIEFLARIRPHVSIPLLRKDFIIDEYQIYEAKAAGADAVLLILAALERARFLALKHLADKLGFEALIEVHCKEELAILGDEPVALIGINNRDLATFETDLSTTARILDAVPPGATIVSESGINSPKDLVELARCGIHAVLIGEALMRAPSPGQALRELLAPMKGETWSG